jgi:hypothetical protein
MKWVTRQRPKVDRVACPWLIAKFIDPQAEFLYVPADDVVATAERVGGYSFDAKDATYSHRKADGGEWCTFEIAEVPVLRGRDWTSFLDSWIRRP